MDGEDEDEEEELTLTGGGYGQPKRKFELRYLLFASSHLL